MSDPVYRTCNACRRRQLIDEFWVTANTIHEHCRRCREVKRHPRSGASGGSKQATIHYAKYMYTTGYNGRAL